MSVFHLLELLIHQRENKKCPTRRDSETICELVYLMKKLSITTLCLSAGLASGFAGFPADRIWIPSTFDAVGFSRISGIYELPLTELSIDGLCQPNLEGAFCYSQPLLGETDPVFHDRLFPPQVEVAMAPVTQQKLLKTHELETAPNPTLAQATLSEPTATFLTGAGTLGLLLFGALVHPRRLTVLWIGK